MATQYECPNCHGMFLSGGWCPECECKLEMIEVESNFPLSREPLHFDPKDDASYETWVKNMINNKHY